MSLKQIIKTAERAGWRVERGAKHFVFLAPNGVDRVTVGATPSRSAYQPMRQHFRKAGLALA